MYWFNSDQAYHVSHGGLYDTDTEQLQIESSTVLITFIFFFCISLCNQQNSFIYFLSLCVSTATGVIFALLRICVLFKAVCFLAFVLQLRDQPFLAFHRSFSCI